MKQTIIFSIILILCMIFSHYSYAADTHSGQAIIESGKASAHASKSAAHAIVGSGQVTSAASAVPLAIGGSAGAVSNEIAKDLMDAATTPIGTPLDISDETVTAGPPPDDALKIKANSDQKPKKEI